LVTPLPSCIQGVSLDPALERDLKQFIGARDFQNIYLDAEVARRDYKVGGTKENGHKTYNYVSSLM